MTPDQIERLKAALAVLREIRDELQLCTSFSPTAAHYYEALADLRAMIARSNLVETEGAQVQSDSCGAPVLRRVGKILVHKDYMDAVAQRTKDLQAHAATARKLAATEAVAHALAGALRHEEQEHVKYGQNSAAYRCRQALATYAALSPDAQAGGKEGA